MVAARRGRPMEGGDLIGQGPHQRRRQAVRLGEPVEEAGAVEGEAAVGATRDRVDREIELGRGPPVEVSSARQAASRCATVAKST